MIELHWPAKIAVWLLPVLFGITVHEVAHGWVARRLGDRTAEMLGRLTLNPLKHVDPVGTVLVPALLFMVGGMILGWAKPVPVGVRNLRKPKRDMALVALAGPLANLLMAVAWAVVARVGLVYHEAAGGAALLAIFMGVAGVVINVVLMVLNMLPLPPLDGGRVLVGLLPEAAAAQVSRIEPFGLMIVLVLLATGLLGRIMGPPIGLALESILGLVGVPADLFNSILASIV